MRRNLLTIILVTAVLVLLIGLNTIFMAEPSAEENEQNGDRSSYKGTHFGTLAYYMLLSDLGYSVSRFEEPYLTLDGSPIGTLFVIMPSRQHEPTEPEIRALERWVRGGGRLVVIDRE